jgi:tetratricopeptide (TPR) repeat protein
MPVWLVFLLLADGAAAPAAAFQQANTEYQRGDFVSAERLYKALLQSGSDDAAIYYNLGNACFKQKKMGEAIYFWEKARRKLPGDPEIRENLELANLLVVDRIETPPDPLALRALDRAAHSFTIRQESWIVLLLWTSVNVALGLRFLGRSARLRSTALASSWGAGVLLVLFACSLGWKIHEARSRVEGVVVEAKADIRSGPGRENVTVFTVHEGIFVRVRGEAAGWYQVSLPNGWSGWVEKDVLRVL